MQFIVVKEFIKTACTRIVVLIIFVHDRDVVNEFGQKGLHPSDRSCELDYLIEGLTHFKLLHGTVDLEVTLEALKRTCWVEGF